MIVWLVKRLQDLQKKHAVSNKRLHYVIDTSVHQITTTSPHHYLLTFNIQLQYVALPVTLPVTPNASVRSSSRSCHALQHQTLVAHDRSGCSVVEQHLPLERRENEKAAIH